MAPLSTKLTERNATYAQNLCCRLVTDQSQRLPRYQSYSAAKLLIYIGFINCFILWQFSESLDFKGLQRYGGNLSTKLSTEILNICKALANQALSALSACVGEAFVTNLATRRTFFAPAL